jgi:predicted metalloendopeptidase
MTDFVRRAPLRFTLTAFALAALSACSKPAAPPADAANASKAAAEQKAPTAPLVSGIDKTNFDTAVRPQDDLFRAVNGAWLAKTEIPADKSNYGSFTKLDDDSEANLRVIIEAAAAKAEKTAGSEEQKVGDLYASFMDEAAIETLGVKAIAEEFAAIDAIKDSAGLLAGMGALAQVGVGVPIYPYVHQDAKDANQYTGDFYQAGLTLPDRDFYLLNDAKFKGIRADYLKHMETMLGLAGIETPAKAAKDILALETRIAKAHWDKVKNRDPVATYNRYLVADLAKLSKEIDWPLYLKAVGFDDQPAIVVSQPSFITAIGKELKATPLEMWKTYLKWHVLDAAAPSMSKALVDENFAFHGKILNGVQENRPRWKRGVEVVENALGEAVGKIYVEKHFPPEAKARMLTLVENLRKAYELSIKDLTWMSDATKQKALEKLAKFRVKIGYPNEWRDYSALEIKAGDLMGNLKRAAQFEYQRNLGKLGKPLDRNEWFMSPQTVNAYYNPEMNEIVFPAAILQPPFFDLNAEDAANYGGIGAVIGHEFSHGFDDQGSQYDGDGNLKSWWADEDRKKFEALTAALAKQYDAYEPIKGYPINGKFTLGENIADLAGLTIAAKAYQLSLGGQPAPVMDGLSGEQRLFMGWAQVWRRKYREENLINRIKTDPHSPSEFRANGTPLNVPSFYSAFGIKETDKMYKPEAERITIW